jgi:glycosyltransferase involved in cell wall biosynthesis
MTTHHLPPLSLHLSIVVPVFRSEDCLEKLVIEIVRALASTGWSYEIIFVNDFSPDNSWHQIESLCAQYPCVVGVDLRRNFGQDNAILTGIRLTRGRYVAVMDDDLQHDPKDLTTLVAKVEQGYDVAYANFKGKRQDLWKNLGSWLNGKIAELVLYKPKGLYISPYKVMRREVAEILCTFEGPSPYIDGLLYQATWRMASIDAVHHSRFAGRGNYSFWRSVGVSARLIFSFSVRPIRLVTWIGLLTSSAAFLAGISVAIYRITVPQDFPPESVGWASLIIVIFLIGGIQLFFIGILGEYVGRTYLRVNDKPQTSVRKIVTSLEETSAGLVRKIR